MQGNTDLLLDEALKGAESRVAETEKILVDKLKLTACKEYYACLNDGKCVIKDDMDEIYDKLLAAFLALAHVKAGATDCCQLNDIKHAGAFFSNTTEISH